MSRYEKHGDSETRLYSIWKGVKKRCNNNRSSVYRHYGGRGIKVCEDWEKSYTSFKLWSIENGYESNLSIDRINPNRDYSPENCRWISQAEQTRNSRSNIKYKGECASVASRRLKGSQMLVQNRIRRGWSKEKAFTTPVLC